MACGDSLGEKLHHEFLQKVWLMRISTWLRAKIEVGGAQVGAFSEVVIYLPTESEDGAWL